MVASTRDAPQEAAPTCARIRDALLHAARAAMRDDALLFSNADARSDALSRADEKKSFAARICVDESEALVENIARQCFVRAAWTASPRDREYSRGGVRRVPTLSAHNLEINARGADFLSNIALKMAASGMRAAPFARGDELREYSRDETSDEDELCKVESANAENAAAKNVKIASANAKSTRDFVAPQHASTRAEKARSGTKKIVGVEENPRAKNALARASESVAEIGANSGASRENVARQVARVLAAYYRGDGEAKEAKGFLNFHLNDDELTAGIARALQERESYGMGTSLQNTRIAIEFVSADPTGPLSFSHAHDAALGDALCRLLELQGASVTREFFLNDDPSSSRMKLLGESVAAHYAAIFSDASTRESALREDVIDNAFVREVAREIAERDGDAHLLVPEKERAAAFSQRLAGRAVMAQKEALNRFGVRFDEWISEQSLGREGRIAFIIQRLTKNRHIFQKDGATWLRSTALGDESDRALQRADGNFTYLATDIAYHAFKIERGFDLLINIWTAAHRPYIERTRIALRAAGYNESSIEMIACEGAKLTRDGASVKRGAELPTLSDALNETEAATLRFSMLLRGWDEIAEFDLESARRDDESNPSYAAQLSYSRLGTLLREAQAHVSSQESAREYSQPFEHDAAARDMARLVAQWPDAAQDAAQSRAPQRIARFVLELAAATRAVAATSNAENAAARVELLQAAQITASASLRVLGLTPREQF